MNIAPLPVASTGASYCVRTYKERLQRRRTRAVRSAYLARCVTFSYSIYTTVALNPPNLAGTKSRLFSVMGAFTARTILFSSNIIDLSIREIHAARGQKATPTNNAIYSISRDYIVGHNFWSVDSGFYDWHFLSD